HKRRAYATARCREPVAVGRSALFRPLNAGCTEAASGGQCVALATLLGISAEPRQQRGRRAPAPVGRSACLRPANAGCTEAASGCQCVALTTLLGISAEPTQQRDAANLYP